MLCICSCWLWIKKLPISGRNIPHITGMESTSNIQHHSHWQDYPQKKSEILPKTNIKDAGALSTLWFLLGSNWRWELLEQGQQRQQVSNLSEEEKIGRRAAGKAYKELPFFTFEPVLVETLNCMVCPLSGQMWNESDKFWTCLKRKRKEEQKEHFRGILFSICTEYSIPIGSVVKLCKCATDRTPSV